MYDSHKWNIWKLLLAIGTTAYFFYSARHYLDWQFLDSVNLIFHEAGHTIFFFFPQFVAVLGGTLLQLIVPILCILHLYSQNHYYSSALMSFWLGQNLVEISLYARDAVSMNLPLLGGDEVIHDWNFMLSQMGMLNKADGVANVIYFVGILIIASAAAYSILHAKDKLHPDPSRRII